MRKFKKHHDLGAFRVSENNCASSKALGSLYNSYAYSVYYSCITLLFCLSILFYYTFSFYCNFSVNAYLLSHRCYAKHLEFVGSCFPSWDVSEVECFTHLTDGNTMLLRYLWLMRSLGQQGSTLWCEPGPSGSGAFSPPHTLMHSHKIIAWPSIKCIWCFSKVSFLFLYLS